MGENILTKVFKENFNCKKNKKDFQALESIKINEKEIVLLYEDNHIIVVVKPNNIASQAGIKDEIDMLSVLKEYIKKKYNKTGNVFLALVHRLDKRTGGIMVFARTSKAASRLSLQIREGDFNKKYLAILLGRQKERHAQLTNWLVKDNKKNKVTIVPSQVQGSKKAILIYKILEYKNNLSLAEISLLTGRCHQIRVQMSWIGTPVLNDFKYYSATLLEKYGTKEIQNKDLMLFAYELSFEHPVKKCNMLFKAFPQKNDEWTIFDLEKYITIVKPKTYIGETNYDK